MTPPHRFHFRLLPLPVSQTAANPTDESDELGALINGDFSTVAQVHPLLRFQAIGACPVPLRSSVMRVVFFKLLATGIFAALVAASSTDPLVVKTCGLAAAVNAVAVVHYAFIWQIRLQSLNIKPLSAWMVGLGRDTKPGGFDKQVYENSSKLYAQEIAVDSLRHSDVCTHILNPLLHTQLSPWPCVFAVDCDVSPHETRRARHCRKRRAAH